MASVYGYTGFVRVFLGQDIATHLIAALENEATAPFHYAAWNGNVEITTALIESGSNPSLPRPDGLTPLHFACYRGHYDLSKLLLERGCAMVQTKAGMSYMTPLNYLSKSGTVVQLLLDNGADHTIRDKDGKRRYTERRRKVVLPPSSSCLSMMQIPRARITPVSQLSM